MAWRYNHPYFYLAVSNVAEAPIPREVRERMFGEEPYTTKPFGTGFGLTTVRKRLEEVGGDFRIVSTQERTEIGVYIPIPT